MNQEYKCHDNFDVCEDYLSVECKENCPYAIRMDRFADTLDKHTKKKKSKFRSGLERFIERYGLTWRKKWKIKKNNF